jgi:hypothetical protein
LIDATDVVRAAWLNGLLASSGINTAVAVLSASTRLARYPVTTDEEVLALVVNTDGVHRRAIWTAWESESRCGRCPALSTVAEIRAAVELPVEPYRRPLPLQERWIRQPGSIGNVRVVVDPEDGADTADLVTQNG